MRHSGRIAFLLWLPAAFCVSVDAAPQDGSPPPGWRIHRSVPPPGAQTHMVVPGERFRAGPFKRWLYGSDYRDLWTTPLEVAVLDLDRVGGGLTPLRTGGFGQSISLHFTGEDGRRYTVRSLDKDPTKRIWDELKGTIADDLLQDLIAALLPTGALVTDPLMEAAGILHSKHRLVVIPDDPRLGKYRAEFAGLIGMLQEHPSEGPDDTPGFAGSRKISGTRKLWKHLGKTPCNRVDAHAYLKARLMDFLIGDKDRHLGQWRWARFPDGECHTWVPIPEDRDQAFIDLDGFAMAVARRGLPRQIEFGGRYPSLVGLTTTGWEMDREFLVELDKAAWDSVVTEFRSTLPDSVIEEAVRKLPGPYYALIGEDLARTLKSRRDALPAFVGRYYQLITRKAEIQATGKDEYVECEHLSDGGLAVRIGLIEKGRRKVPYFQREFRPGETREVRIYLRGGDDLAEVTGPQGPITVRIDGGAGNDLFANRSQAGAAQTRFYDFRGDNRFGKGRARIDERPYKRPPATALRARYALDWGRHTISFPVLVVTPDLGVYVGGVASRQYFGYRKDPFASSHSLNAGLAVNRLKPSVSYTGTFRQAKFGLDAKVRLTYTGLQVIRFNGLGNETRIRRASFYEVEQNHFVFAPSLEFVTGGRPAGGSQGGLTAPRPAWTVGLGPVLKYSNTPSNANRGRFIASGLGRWYGTGSFGQVGMQGEILYDARDHSGYPTRGVLTRIAGAFFPGVWDVVDWAFGSLEGETRAYLTAPVPTAPTLALRAGGKKVWGTVPFHEHAFLGGPGLTGGDEVDHSVRGLRKNRFAGDASLFGNAELRLVLAEIRLLVPGEVGLFAAADAGRVIYSGDPDGADTWHTGTGGGLWLSFLQRMQTVSLAVVNGEDLTGVYLRAGLTF